MRVCDESSSLSLHCSAYVSRRRGTREGGREGLEDNEQRKEKDGEERKKCQAASERKRGRWRKTGRELSS